MKPGSRRLCLQCKGELTMKAHYRDLPILMDRKYKKEIHLDDVNKKLTLGMVYSTSAKGNIANDLLLLAVTY